MICHKTQTNKHVYCFTFYVIWRLLWWMCNIVEFGNLCFTSLNWVLTLLKQPKNICCVKDGVVDHRAVTRWLKKFCTGCKSLDDQAKSGAPSHKANPASNTQKVSGVLGVSQSSGLCHFLHLGKSKWSCQIVLHVTKILQNFWLTLGL